MDEQALKERNPRSLTEEKARMTFIGDVNHRIDLSTEVAVSDRSPSKDGKTPKRYKGARPFRNGYKIIKTVYGEDNASPYVGGNSNLIRDIDTHNNPIEMHQYTVRVPRYG